MTLAADRISGKSDHLPTAYLNAMTQLNKKEFMNSRTIELGREMMRPKEGLGEWLARAIRRKVMQTFIFVLWFFAVGGVATTFVLCKYDVTITRADVALDEAPMHVGWNPAPKTKHSKVYR